MRPTPAPASGTVERWAERLHEALEASFGGLLPRFEGSRFEERVGYLFLVCPALPLPQLNGVWAKGPEEEQLAVRELAGAVAQIEGLGLPCWVQTRAGRTPALEAEARRLGLTSEEAIPGMVATVDDLREVTSPEVEITRVVDAARLAEAQAVEALGFEVPPDLFAPFYSPQVAATPGLSIFLGRADGRPVSTATSFRQGEAVGIFNVATPPEYRRRGYGTALTARAARDGFEAAASFAWLQSSPLGDSVYRRMGFRQVETYTLLSRPAKNNLAQ
jgi:ribosomal protein S18 acetylase RimI-like enzyme